MTEAGFAAMTGLLRDVGASLGTPVAAVLEGGYGLDGLARSVRASMEALAAPAGEVGAGSVAWSPLVRGARARVGRRWPALAG